MTLRRWMLGLLSALSCLTVRGAPPAMGGRLDFGTAFEPDATQISSIRRFSFRSRYLTAVFRDDLSIQFWVRERESDELKMTELRFRGANEHSKLECRDRLSGVVSYYFGNDTQQWRTNVPRFRELRFRDAYPGIDVVFSADAGQLTLGFAIGPGANVRAIQFRFENARARLTERGELLIDDMSIVQKRPTHSHTKTSDEVRWKYGFDSDGYVSLETTSTSPADAIALSPTLVFSSYVGGVYFDTINAIGTDAAGNIFVAGETDSPGFFDSAPFRNKGRDAFVAALSADGRQLVFLAYFGGNSVDAAQGMSIDGRGAIYVVGNTQSSDFPTTPGALAPFNNGGQDAFALKMSATGVLLYSTYIGGPASDQAWAIATDANGAAYITGQTSSSGFPTTSGAVQSTNKGGWSDCFITKLNSSGTAVVYSTFFGGTQTDSCRSIAVDTTGAVYVAGSSSSPDLPATTVLQHAVTGSEDAFVAKLNASGSQLVYCTILGAGMPSGIALDASGAAYATGTTTAVDFTTTPNAAQGQSAGVYDAFIAKLTPDGAGLVYSTLLGGSGTDTATAITVDASGRAIITGYTNSPDLRVTSAIQTVNKGAFDAFVGIASADGTKFDVLTYLGGSNDDRAYAVAFAPDKQIVLAGTTASLDFPVSAQVHQGRSAGSYDGFVLKLAIDAAATSPRTILWETAKGQILTSVLGGDKGVTIQRNEWVTSLEQVGWNLVGVADFNGDGVDDLVWQSSATGQSQIWFMGRPLGDTLIGAATLTSNYAPDWRIAGLADMNRDGKPDIIFQHTSGIVQVWYMTGPQGNTFLDWAWLSKNIAPTWILAAICDLNLDGIPDLIWQEQGSRIAEVWYMGGSRGDQMSNWAWLSTHYAPGWRIAAVADLNLDGNPDILWQLDDNSGGQIWFIGGAGSTSLMDTAPLPNPSVAAALKAIR